MANLNTVSASPCRQGFTTISCGKQFETMTKFYNQCRESGSDRKSMEIRRCSTRQKKSTTGSWRYWTKRLLIALISENGTHSGLLGDFWSLENLGQFFVCGMFWRKTAICQPVLARDYVTHMWATMSHNVRFVVQRRFFFGFEPLTCNKQRPSPQNSNRTTYPYPTLSQRDFRLCSFEIWQGIECSLIWSIGWP